MPNYCSYELKAVGEKENLLKLHEIMNNDYKVSKNNPEHLWRVFEADMCDEDEDCIVIIGNCAWSVYSCMFDGPHTYQSEDNTGRGTTIVELSKELNLVIEIFSEEPGMGFMEHYVIDHGSLITNDEYDYQCYYVGEYKDAEEANNDLELKGENKITQEEFDIAIKDSEEVKRGGIEWEFTI